MAKGKQINRRAKGSRFERFVAARLAEMGLATKRGWQARSGADAADVEGLPGWWIECHHGRTAPEEKYDQAKLAAEQAHRKSDCVVAICKRNYYDPTVTMSVKDLARMFGMCALTGCEFLDLYGDSTLITMDFDSWCTVIWDKLVTERNSNVVEKLKMEE